MFSSTARHTQTQSALLMHLSVTPAAGVQRVVSLQAARCTRSQTVGAAVVLHWWGMEIHGFGGAFQSMDDVSCVRIMPYAYITDNPHSFDCTGSLFCALADRYQAHMAVLITCYVSVTALQGSMAFFSSFPSQFGLALASAAVSTPTGIISDAAVMAASTRVRCHALPCAIAMHCSAARLVTFHACRCTCCTQRGVWYA